MTQKNELLTCANTLLVDECTRLRTGQPASPAVAMVMDPDALLVPKPTERWWGEDL